MDYVSLAPFTANMYRKLLISQPQGSATCFLLASYSSQPHITEVMRGAYGREEDEIDNDVYNMMGSTDLTTATMILDGPACWKEILRNKGTDELGDQGLGRVMRLTRCEDLGLRIFDRALTKVSIFILSSCSG